MTELKTLEQLQQVATAGPVLIEHRDDDDGSVDFVVYAPKGDMAACFETANNNARANASYIAALLNAAPRLIACAKFVEEHGSTTFSALRSAKISVVVPYADHAKAAFDALRALLESRP